MYHALEDTRHPLESGDIGSQMYVVSQDAFLKQMEYLAENGFTVLLLDELAQLSRWPDKGIVLTFDDGHSSNYTIAYEILRKFGFRAHFFLTTSWLNSPGFLSTAQIQEMATMGMSIGSHGVTHSFFDDMSKAMVLNELQQSKEVLESYVSGPLASFSAPGGRYSTSVIVIARELGYKIFCSSVFDLLTQKGMEEVIPRLAVKQNTSLQTFQKMANGDRSFIRKQRAIVSALSILKKLLGNRVYVLLRGLVLKIVSFI